MKRQSSSTNKSILHFFKSAPRTSQENTTATVNTTTDNVSRPPTSSDQALPKLTQSSPASSSASSGVNTSNAADAPNLETIMTSNEAPPPRTSQTSANSGASKRVLSHGRQVVLNSDSDSDSTGELDFGLPAPKLKVPTYAGRSSRRLGYDEPELRRPSKAGRNNGKRSFNQLIDVAQRNLDAERKIQEHKASLEKVDDQSTAVAGDLDKDTLKHVVRDGEDSDQADRLYKAMQRTNEVRAHAAYHFFTDIPNLSIVPPFPQRSLPDHGWTACFEEPATRDQAFMSGFAHQVFRLQELPKELATWMIDQICLGRNAALDQKYLEILKLHDKQLQKLLSPKRLSLMFKSISAQVESLDVNTEITPSEAQANNQRPLPPSLKRIAALLTSAAPWLHAKARTHAFHLLCHVCLDDRLLLDPDVLFSVQDAIEAVICQYADNHKLTSDLTHVIPKLLTRVSNPLLQANLIHAFPTKSPLTAYLQRHLALSFLFHPTAVDLPLADQQLPRLIHVHIETSPHYRMGKETNYSFVVARLALLDIAIGPGLLTVPYMPLTSPPPSDAGSSPPLAPTPASSEVREFNKEVDALAQHIKLLSNSIVETGAALDLTILEAKERCERVYWRLQHAVRIGGKKADNVFGDGEGVKQLKVQKFFKPFPKTSTPKESIFNQNGDTELPA